MRRVLYAVHRALCFYFEVEDVLLQKQTITLIIKDEAAFKTDVNYSCDYQYINPLKELPITSMN